MSYRAGKPFVAMIALTFVLALAGAARARGMVGRFGTSRASAHNSGTPGSSHSGHQTHKGSNQGSSSSHQVGRYAHYAPDGGTGGYGHMNSGGNGGFEGGMGMWNRANKLMSFSLASPGARTDSKMSQCLGGRAFAPGPYLSKLTSPPIHFPARELWSPLMAPTPHLRIIAPIRPCRVLLCGR